MSATYTRSIIETFTLLHARIIASKIATDLQRFQRFYGKPTDQKISDYELEITQLLKHDVVSEVVYGFRRSGKWTEAAVRYKALPGGTLEADDDPGKIRPGMDVAGALFTSFLTHNDSWSAKSVAQQQAIEAELPFRRGTGDAPTLEVGYWYDDKNYIAGGRGVGRSTVRRYA
jgi:hypothetical protein